ncbi:hypothetical protein D3C71_1260100 [compost metagenome]
MRLIQQQILDVLRVQLGRDGSSGDTASSDQSHGRETAFQFFDLGEVFAIGHQLTLLNHERIAVALQTVDFHQLETQITALRLLLDALFQQRGSLVQATGSDVRLGLTQHIVRALGGWSDQRRCDRWRYHNRGNHWRWRRCRSGRKLHAWRWNFQAFEAAFRQVEFGGELLLFGQGTGHAQVFLGFLLGFAATCQQQQQQQNDYRPATGQTQ